MLWNAVTSQRLSCSTITTVMRALCTPWSGPAGTSSVAPASATMTPGATIRAASGRYFRFALVLRDSYGWSLDRIEGWIAAISRALLLGQPH